MPTFRVLVNLALNQLDKALIGRFSMSIFLSIIWGRFDQLDTHIGGKPFEFL
jgi:hypothetical protein